MKNKHCYVLFNTNERGIYSNLIDLLKAIDGQTDVIAGEFKNLETAHKAFELKNPNYRKRSSGIEGNPIF